MITVSLRKTRKGTAVVVEKIDLMDKKLFDTYAAAAAYASKLDVTMFNKNAQDGQGKVSEAS